MRILALITLLLLCAGCPQDDAGEQAGQFVPSSPIPAGDPLTQYDQLWLGMSSLELAQAYNAPEGQGAGFTRVLEQYGDVAHHLIDFTRTEGQPARRIVASFFRDRLYILVDRREHITVQQRDLWFSALTERYGKGYQTVLPSSQWRWGDPAGLLVTFTQDNASDQFMSANVVLEHQPTRNAAHDYLVHWEAEHPEQFKKQGPAPAPSAESSE